MAKKFVNLFEAAQNRGVANEEDRKDMLELMGIQKQAQPAININIGAQPQQQQQPAQQQPAAQQPPKPAIPKPQLTQPPPEEVVVPKQIHSSVGDVFSGKTVKTPGMEITPRPMQTVQTPGMEVVQQKSPITMPAFGSAFEEQKAPSMIEAISKDAGHGGDSLAEIFAKSASGGADFGVGQDAAQIGRSLGTDAAATGAGFAIGGPVGAALIGGGVKLLTGLFGAAAEKERQVRELSTKAKMVETQQKMSAAANTAANARQTYADLIRNFQATLGQA